jgi:hypothetical protein
LDQVCLAALDWIEKNKENTDLNILESKTKEIEAEVKPILSKIDAADLPPPPQKSAKRGTTPK